MDKWFIQSCILYVFLHITDGVVEPSSTPSSFPFVTLFTIYYQLNFILYNVAPMATVALTRLEIKIVRCDDTIKRSRGAEREKGEREKRRSCSVGACHNRLFLITFFHHGRVEMTKRIRSK